ncbi:hypothetical protein QQ045_014240 [Rhodiola kirilowii]
MVTKAKPNLNPEKEWWRKNIYGGDIVKLIYDTNINNTAMTSECIIRFIGNVIFVYCSLLLYYGCPKIRKSLIVVKDRKLDMACLVGALWLPENMLTVLFSVFVVVLGLLLVNLEGWDQKCKWNDTSYMPGYCSMQELGEDVSSSA